MNLNEAIETASGFLEPEGKLALAHYDAAFALQEIVFLQTLYTERFSRMCRLDGGSSGSLV